METPPRPDNYLVLSVICTVCCCIPFGVYAIFRAAKVGELYALQQYEAAAQASADAKKWSIIGIIVSAICLLIYYSVILIFSLKEMQVF